MLSQRLPRMHGNRPCAHHPIVVYDELRATDLEQRRLEHLDELSHVQGMGEKCFRFPALQQIICFPGCVPGIVEHTMLCLPAR